MRVIRMAMFMVASFVASIACAAPPDVTQLISSNSYPVSFGDGTLGGPGAEFLARQTANSQFVLLGESHYQRDIPIFAGALFKMLEARHGYHHLVVEQDPVAMEQALSPPFRGNAAKLGSLAHHYPSLFEYASDQDLALLAEVGRLERGPTAICGLEQATGARKYFDELVKLAPDRRIAAEVRTLAAVDAKDDSQAKYSVNFLAAAGTGERLAKLRDDWSPRAGSRADWLLQALIKSAEIFGYYRRAQAGEYVGLYNNTVREQWLKKQFMRCYSAASRSERLPRMLFKFGANHMFHGMDTTSAFPIGNFAHEFAIAHGMDGYGIVVVALAPGRGYADMPEWLLPLLPTQPPKQPVLVDLQPLRPFQRVITSQRKVADQESFRRLLFGFEALLIIPNSRPATMKLSGLSAP